MADKPEGQDDPSIVPRRFKVKLLYPWAKRPVGSYVYGVYFPDSGLCVTSRGAVSTGIPQGKHIVWVDGITDCLPSGD